MLVKHYACQALCSSYIMRALARAPQLETESKPLHPQAMQCGRFEGRDSGGGFVGEDGTRHSMSPST